MAACASAGREAAERGAAHGEAHRQLSYTLLAKKLGAKGRERIVGQTVYAIEGGAYRVSLLKPRSADAPDRNRLLVFSPKNSGDLLGKLMRGLVTPRGWDRVIGEGNPVPPSFTGVLIESGQEVARLFIPRVGGF